MSRLDHGHIFQPGGELRGDAEQLLVFRPQLLMVLEQAAVLISENVTSCVK